MNSLMPDIVSLTLDQFLAQPETKPASEYHAGEIHHVDHVHRECGNNRPSRHFTLSMNSDFRKMLSVRTIE